MLPATESQIQKSILDYCKLKNILIFKHRNVGIYKQATNQYIPLADGEKGISDIIGCLKDGRFLAIEVKRPGAKPSADQNAFLEKVRDRNGVAFWTDSLEEAIGYLAPHV